MHHVTINVTDKKMHRIDKSAVRIGRTDEADITIGKSTISARHAQIAYKDNAFYLMDLGSRNGTYLGKTKQRITSEVQLKNDDFIYFEQYKFTFLIRGEEKGEVGDEL